jgi:serine/threonine protein kinase
MGWLPDGREVAIKRLGHDSWQGIEEFQAEVTILHSVSHKHIVRVVGSCVLQEKRQLLPRFWKRNEKQRYLLVYEFAENRSLDIHLYNHQPSPVTVSWKMRIEILLGVSRAIEHLQSYAERPVIHRDVKPSNILLDASWEPRLTDFGLALTWEGPDHKDRVCGTLGYLAPEYAMRGTVNLTTDVYSFGVVMLEVLTGKRPHLLEEEREKERERKAYVEKERRDLRELEEEIREEWEKEQQMRDEWKEKGERGEFEEEEQKRDEWKEKEERNECEVEEETTEERGEKKERPEQDNLAGAYYGLVELVVPLIEEGELWKVLDRRPANKPTPRQLEATELVAEVAVRCVRLDWEARPSISEVVATLETALELARCDG